MKPVQQFLSFLLFVLMSAGALAQALPQLPANVPEAGLAWGQAAPGSAVHHQGKALPVLESGHFLFAVPQLARGETELAIATPGQPAVIHAIPVTGRAWPIQRIDGLPGKMVTPPASVTRRIAQEAAQIAAVRRKVTLEPHFLSGFIMPAKGRHSGDFGGRRILNGIEKQPHRGFDIAAPVGTPVVAPMDGIVSLVHPDMFYTGQTVVLDHGHGLSSILIHLSRIDVKEGQLIRQGEQVGAIGQTGRATGPHLHWGVFLGDVAVDPEQAMAVLPAKAAQP